MSSFCDDDDVVTRRYGMIFLDPLDPEMKKLAAPLYSAAARHARDCHRCRTAQPRVGSRRISRAGARHREFLSAVFTRCRWRAPLVRVENGKYQAKDTDQQHSIEELAELALNEPQRFSPNVTLRAVVQDYLLPTIAYHGGAAEIAYFAQTAEVYRVLGRPATPILPRSSLTMIERHTGRVLERYGLSLADFFEGLEPVTKRVVEEYLGADTSRHFSDAEQNVNQELDRLKRELHAIDPTLADALETGRKDQLPIRRIAFALRARTDDA